MVFSFLSTAGVMLIVWQAALLYRVPRQNHWQKRLILIIVSGSTYVVLYLMDVRSVISLVTSDTGADIPLTSTLRTASIALLLLVLARITNSATRAQVGKKMTPPDLIVIGLLVQAVALGHGSLQVFYEPRRPRWWFWLPLTLVIAYYIFAALVPPAALDRHAPVTLALAPATLALWLSAWRYVTQVAGFALVVEALLYVLRKQGQGLRRGREGSFGGRP